MAGRSHCVAISLSFNIPVKKNAVNEILLGIDNSDCVLKVYLSELISSLHHLDTEKVNHCITGYLIHVFTHKNLSGTSTLGCMQ